MLTEREAEKKQTCACRLGRSCCREHDFALESAATKPCLHTGIAQRPDNGVEASGDTAESWTPAEQSSSQKRSRRELHHLTGSVSVPGRYWGPPTPKEDDSGALRQDALLMTGATLLMTGDAAVSRGRTPGRLGPRRS